MSLNFWPELQIGADGIILYLLGLDNSSRARALVGSETTCRHVSILGYHSEVLMQKSANFDRKYAKCKDFHLCV